MFPGDAIQYHVFCSTFGQITVLVWGHHVSNLKYCRLIRNICHRKYISEMSFGKCRMFFPVSVCQPFHHGNHIGTKLNTNILPTDFWQRKLLSCDRKNISHSLVLFFAIITQPTLPDLKLLFVETNVSVISTNYEEWRIHLRMSSKWSPLCLVLNVLNTALVRNTCREGFPSMQCIKPIFRWYIINCKLPLDAYSVHPY